MLALIRTHCIRVRLAFIEGEVAGTGFLPSNLLVTVNVADETHVVNAVVLWENVDLRAGEPALFTVDRLKVNVGVFGQFRLVARLIRNGE